MKPGSPARWRVDSTTAARLALGGLSILVLLLSLGFAVAVSAIVRRSEAALEASLATAAALLADAFPRDSLFAINASYDPATRATDLATFAEYIELGLGGTQAFEQAIRDAAQRREGVAVRVLSNDGAVLFDASGAVTTGEPAPHAREDAALLRDAALGIPGASDRDSRAPVRVYQPIDGQDGEVIAVLQLTAEPAFGAWARLLVRRVLVVACLTVALILVLWVSVSRLIARIRHAEKAADQSDRLRALGTATAGIAHEIRNPLSIIGLSVEEIKALSRDVPEGQAREGIERAVVDLQGEVRRLRDLTEQFLDFARDTPREDASPLDLSEGAAAVVRLFGKGARGVLRVEFAPSSEPLPVQLGEARLRQVLLNLLRNADEALGERGGVIVVRARRAKDAAQLEVEDDGPGMQADVLAQVFDPFFTTRPEGTGLGLPLSRSLIESVGGSLEVRSAPGSGTRVVLSLPLVTPSPRPAA